METETILDDQWEKNGDCSKCRKQAYCSKSCKARNNYIDAKIRDSIRKTSAGKILSMFGGL